MAKYGLLPIQRAERNLLSDRPSRDPNAPAPLAPLTTAEHVHSHHPHRSPGALLPPELPSGRWGGCSQRGRSELLTWTRPGDQIQGVTVSSF